MNKPRITIQGFEEGMVEDENKNTLTGCQLIQQLDVFTKKGVLQASDDVSAGDSTTKLATSACMFADGSGNGNEPYAIAGKYIYRYRSGSWSLVHTNTKTSTAGSNQFIMPYSKDTSGTYNALYYTSDGFIGYYHYDGAAEDWTNDDHATFSNADTKSHPLETHAGYLYAGDGNYVARIEPNGASFDADALVLPTEWRVMCMKPYADRLNMGCWKGVNIYDTAEARLFTWDGVTGNEEELSLPLGECGIQAIYPYQNYLFVFAGVKGNIYYFNGAKLNFFRTIPDIIRRAHIKPGAVCEFKGKLLFGLSNDDGYAGETAKQGIWSISRKHSYEPFALALDYLENGGSTIQNQIGFIMPNADASGIFFGRYNNSNYKINNTSAWGAAKQTGGKFKSQKYFWARGNNLGTALKAVEILAKSIPSGCSIDVDYKLDNASSWTTGVSFSSGEKKEKKTIGSSPAKVAQIRLIFNTSGGDSPQIYKILIY